MSGDPDDKARHGRPRNDDRARLEEILFRWNILGRPLGEVLDAAAADLVRASQAAANEAVAQGRRRPVISQASARRRLKDGVEAEQRAGIGPMTGLPPALRLVGAITGGVARRDGYQAGRQLLVESLGRAIAFGNLQDPWHVLQCTVLADLYIAEIEAKQK